jgi:hypothetical protein
VGGFCCARGRHRSHAPLRLNVTNLIKPEIGIAIEAVAADMNDRLETSSVIAWAAAYADSNVGSAPWRPLAKHPFHHGRI